MTVRRVCFVLVFRCRSCLIGVWDLQGLFCHGFVTSSLIFLLCVASFVLGLPVVDRSLSGIFLRGGGTFTFHPGEQSHLQKSILDMYFVQAWRHLGLICWLTAIWGSR